MAFDVKITDKRMDAVTCNVRQFSEGQLFRCDDGIGLKLDFGWILLYEGAIIPYVDDEASNDPQFEKCQPVDGHVDIKVSVDN